MHRKTGKQVNKIEDIPGSATVEMNFTRTSSNPEVENFQISDSYIPITPLKPILPKSTPISTQKQENWYSEEGFLFSTEFAHGTQDYRIPACCETANSVDITNGFHNWEEALAGRSHDSGGDHIFRDFSADPNTFQNGSFGNLIALANAAATRETQNAAPQGDVNAETGSFFPVYKTHFDSNRLEASSATSSPAKQDFPYGSNLWSNGNWAPDMPLFANSIPPHPTYDLNSPPDALMDAFLGQNIPTQFAPITPDLSKSKNGMQKLSADERRNQIRQEGNEIATTRLEVEELHNKDQQQVPKGLSSTVESTQLQENHNSDKGGNAEIDLNKTPHQKTKRKKHRPKVVTEDKPKRTPKAVTPKAEGTTENLTGKRKYVRKNELNETPHTPMAEVASQDTSPRNASLTEKPCKRALIFDLEGEVRKESNVDSESQAQNFSTRVESKSKVQLGQGIEVVIEKTELGIAYDLTRSVNKVLKDYISMPERQPINPNTPNKTDSLQRDMMAHVQNDHARGKCQIVFSDETHDKQKSNMNVSMRTETQSTRLSSMIEGKQERGLKRGNLHINGDAGPNCKHVVGGHYNSLHEYLAMFSANSLNSNGIAGMHFPTIYKKKRSEKVHSSTTSSSVCVVNSSENHAKHAIQYSNISAAPHTTEYTSIRTASYLDSLGKQSFECGPAVDQIGRMKKKRSKGPTRVRDLASLMGIVACGRFPTFPAGRAPICGDMQKYGISNPPKSIEALVAETRATMTTKKRTKRISFTTCTNTGAIQKRPSTIEEIIGLLESLDINSHRNQVRKQDKRALVPFNFRFEERNALVLYQREGTVAPFEGSFDPIRKRRPRPKVDLDEETNRVWKLLLENINSEGIDGTDEDKAKWWEEERRVFQGRADSFIARMHLVQGDRRFSPWKGSVLDSVVGVFLTQNVSDHLSSSAFMSLAARFPLNSNGDCRPCSEGTNILDKEPEVCILDTEDIVEWHSEKWNRSTSHMNSIKLHDKHNIAGTEVVNRDESLGRSSSCKKSTDQMKCKSFGIFGKGLEIDDSSITQREAFQLKEVMESFTGEREMDDVLSSQFSVSTSKDSVDSSVAQTSGSMEPCLQENLETVPGTRSKPDNFLLPSFVELLQMAESSHVHDKKTANVSSFKENGFTNMEATECDAQRERLDMSNNRQASLRPINPSRNFNLQMNPNARATRVESWEILGAERPFFSNFKRHEENCMSEQSGVTAESVSQVTVQKNETSSSLEVPKYQSESNHVCSSPQVDVNKTFPSQNMLSGHPKDNIQSERESTNMINIKKKTEHKEVESSLNERGYFPDKAINGRSSDSSKLRGRTGKQKQSSENWDSLRLQAQAEGKRRARTANTMDSLDWEAVRCADVNEIADTIKERGMNNLLAERIKDFLNRLVREHGNTDLEWLRDVPPDKAKEYLLSVRGLGLKSVECVRLLTLHHLAFPVDTNVGRIAVRLGWVPLQPLPESLQLHLLELYPVLESIQRYLWPRLCKLDQRTLYELHYQMITFGKVFCTKNKPNCNACPMRGECRHFASAFASARLALPGPEERSIVSAMENKSTYQNPAEVIKHLQLPQPQSNHQLQTQYQLNCLPIVEVPATPEPIVEVPATPELEQPPQIPECDIEDAFGEDPEEIPTIKLNIEEFAQNLQNYMHQNMELQESDVSKALVALTSEAASIPTPKLKNVSRLRTEHHVYELPDSHPLLEGLDRREPDDPCSYLLAIWTPGETASSITPPEGKCSSQEFGQLCDEMTCFSCNSFREATSQTVRGTLLIPCRTAMRGSFPLNGTYFQVNEVFADHASSMNPIDVPRAWIWNLPRRTVYFGTSIPSIFKGLTTESIQFCFWRGFVCVRGFDQKTRSPRPLMARLHFPASKLARTKGKPTDQQE